MATPVDGGFTLTGSFTYSSAGFSWSSASIVGASGIYGPVNGTTVTPSAVPSSDPVGSVFVAQPFLNFPSDPALASLNIDFITAGIYSAAGCNATPAAPGQSCSPANSPFNFLNVSGNQSTLAFSFKGVSSDGNDTWDADFTTQFASSFQTILAQYAASGSVTTTYSATVTAIPVPSTPPTGVPEPLTLSLFGAGLAGAVALRKRKRELAVGI